MRTVTRLFTGVLVAAIVCGAAGRSTALYHIVVIDEMLTGYGGDPSVQFVEIRMLAGAQNLVTNSVFAAFDSSGTYIGDILDVPANVPNSGSGVRWLIGTEAFQAASGVAPDFVMPAGVLPPDGGMVCFGGGGGVIPENPPDWDRTNFATYVDCVAYGTYSGSPNVRTGTPTALDGNGHSLQRVGQTGDNAADFECGDPATPENNAGATASLPATTPCGGGAACVGDCDGDGMVAINELITGVNIALAVLPTEACEAMDCQNDGTVPINCLVQAVNNALNGCPNGPVAIGATSEALARSDRRPPLLLVPDVVGVLAVMAMSAR